MFTKAPSPLTNPFADFSVAARYEDWYAGPGREADELEKRLLAKLLACFPGAKTALEVGCGTGHCTRWLQECGLRAIGLDLSWPMLLEARRLQSPPCLQGDALALPFADRSIDLVALITTVEFVENPLRTLEEAVRVARQGLMLGVLNRRSLLVLQYRISGEDVWRAAHFYSVGELKRLVVQAAKGRFQSLRWRTTLWPIPHLPDLPVPWGGFIGLAAQFGEDT
ncbi:MAG: class I SAM-dependent methyltransferase [Nitrospira sp. WS110]|nr:class I SAM-dependent methyltransferase [Nitrospira sp. WS110]